MIRTAALLTFALLLLPSTAHASRNMELALQDDAVFVDQRWMDREKALDHAADLRTKRIRVNVIWSRVLIGGTYHFEQLDNLHAAAASRGIKLQMTLTGPAPASATRNHSVGGYRPSPAKFAAFARTVATHFKGRVDRYSIWNEPNLSAWLSPSKSAPKLYRSLYRSGYTAVKRVDPQAQVLFGELAPYRDGRTIAPLKFLRDVACARCAPLKADGLALHPYQFTKAPTVRAGGPDDAPISRLRQVTKTLDQLAKRRKLATPKGRGLHLYLTEFGYLSSGRRKQSARRRSAWLSSAYKLARKNPRVKQLLQYQLVDPPARERWHSAILDRKGRRLAPYAGLARAAGAR
jgi:hypothetical protein